MAERIAFIGIGNMGFPMMQRLHERGFALRVRDVDERREQDAAALGVAVMPTPAEAARGCELLIVVVVDDRQIHEVLFGADGAADVLGPGAAVMLCPTVSPEAVESVAGQLAARGIGCLDAAMSGGPARAADGTMSLMLAAPAALLARWRTVLDVLSDRPFVVGERPGDGARTKLVNNLLAAVNLAGAAEALALATRLGLDPARTLDVIDASSGQSWIGAERLRRALAGEVQARAHVSLLAKDSALALALARDAGAAVPVGDAAAAVFAAAVREGLRDEDDSVLYRRALGG